VGRSGAPQASTLHPKLLEVEFPLDRAERRVVDLTPVAQLDDRFALRRDDAALDLLVLESLLAALRRLAAPLTRRPG